jgi:hypothetical protein
MGDDLYPASSAFADTVNPLFSATTSIVSSMAKSHAGGYQDVAFLEVRAHDTFSASARSGREARALRQQI